MKLNVGCGTDYRVGFVNIDASATLEHVDVRLDIVRESLLSRFGRGTIEFILAYDVIEHHYHWEAVRLLRDFFELLMQDGQLEIRVPDAAYIIGSGKLALTTKLTILFGGQDIPQSGNPEMEESRRQFPHLFCHKYGWTIEAMTMELERIGFQRILCERAGVNFVCRAWKSKGKIAG